jgi:hypothetical protein
VPSPCLVEPQFNLADCILIFLGHGHRFLLLMRFVAAS